MVVVYLSWYLVEIDLGELFLYLMYVIVRFFGGGGIVYERKGFCIRSEMWFFCLVWVIGG